MGNEHKSKAVYPEVIFVYSPPFDERIKKTSGVKKMLERDKRDYPSREEIEILIKKLESYWNEHGREILKQISEISNLKWIRKEIRCYLVGIQRPISEPLLIGIYHMKTFEDIVDIFIHELIHIIQTENRNLLKDWATYVEDNYREEPFQTGAHISIHSIQWKVFEKVFDKKRILRVIERDSIDKGYARSWEIIKNKGPENIINEFRNSVKRK